MCPFLFVYLLKVSSMINSVRNAVLTILNKNNYGYISPADFNLLAQNAQMELYEEYYSNYNKTINAENVRTSGTQYADIRKPLSEVLESFLVSKLLVPNYLNVYYYPSEITTGYNAYMVSKINVYNKKIINSTNTFVSSPSVLDDSAATFISLGVKPGDIVVVPSTFEMAVVVNVLTETRLTMSSGILPNIDTDYYIYDSTVYSEAEKVNNNNILHLVKSNLTAPSETYPAYSVIGDSIAFYPESIMGYGAVRADYFRYPKPPKWTYVTLSGGEPAFDQSQPDYQDFELPLEDEYKLVTKILEYCGIVIREIEVSQFGSAQQQHEQPTFSMQQ